jgi:hypothetical protein
VTFVGCGSPENWYIPFYIFLICDNDGGDNDGEDNDGECDSDFVFFYEMESDSDEVGQGYSKCHSLFEKC